MEERTITFLNDMLKHNSDAEERLRAICENGLLEDLLDPVADLSDIERIRHGLGYSGLLSVKGWSFPMDYSKTFDTRWSHMCRALQRFPTNFNMNVESEFVEFGRRCPCPTQGRQKINVFTVRFTKKEVNPRRVELEFQRRGYRDATVHEFVAFLTKYGNCLWPAVKNLAIHAGGRAFWIRTWSTGGIIQSSSKDWVGDRLVVPKQK